MTMQELLEGIRGLGERFDRHAKRLQALERETGMVDDPDDDDDDEAKKKAEKAMADDDDKDDDDPDKDRGRSTRTPGQTIPGPMLGSGVPTLLRKVSSPRIQPGSFLVAPAGCPSGPGTGL